jgi:threonine dehydrogenase-like Zn-dependent dehydrogenase
VNRDALVFVGPGQVEVVTEDCPEPGPGQLRVRTAFSGISAGTELLAYRGQLPADLVLDDTLPSLQGGVFRYPFRYGYAAVGTVEAVGPGVDRAWIDRRVFSFQPHATRFVCAVDAAFALPEGIDPERAVMYPSQETALNLVLDGQVGVYDRVAVLGQGVVGLCTTSLLARFPLQALVAVEVVSARAADRAADGRAGGGLGGRGACGAGGATAPISPSS